MNVKNIKLAGVGRMALLSFIIIPALSGCLTGEPQVTNAASEGLTEVSDVENTAKNTRPNILFIMSDDHSERAISAYGSKLINTPNIDRIANEGVLFKNSFVANSICGPSRAVMLTGKHSHINGFTDNHSSFDGTQPTYPQYL